MLFIIGFVILCCTLGFLPAFGVFLIVMSVYYDVSVQR